MITTATMELSSGKRTQDDPIMQQLSKVKVVTLGDASVGKTSLTTYLVDGVFRETYTATVGAGFLAKAVEVEGYRALLQIWDTAGQERFRSLAPFYLRDAEVAVIVFDVTDQESFGNLEYWIQCAHKNAMNSIHVVIVGNKVDLKQLRVVDTRRGEAFAARMGMPYVETSAKTGHNVEELFSQIVRYLKDHPKELPPLFSPLEKSITLAVPAEEEEKFKKPARSKCC